MANLLLGVTGSVAAIQTPELFTRLTQTGWSVKVVATHAARYFFDVAAVDPLPGELPRRNPEVLILDDDEWPGERYLRSEKVLHIELRRWAELFLIAPLDANTLAKLAQGLCDNCLTCVWRAWDRSRPAILAPAMNTLMWEHPATARHLRQLAADALPDAEPAGVEPAVLPDWINAHCPKLRVIPPQIKRLACDDVGMGAMGSLDSIMEMVAKVSLSSAKAGRSSG
jgi:phosphopantothenoylcysteine decarboxylase